VHLIPFVASGPAELRALEPSALSHSDGLLVMPGGMFWNNRATIIGIAAIRTAHALGIALSPDFVSAANEVIE
jgi:hypothetical protein